MAAARQDGVPPSSLRSLASPFRGVRSHTEIDAAPARLRALALVHDGGFAASHCTAAAVANAVFAATGQRLRRLPFVA